MDKMPLTALVFQSIPESIILFALGLTLLGVPLRWKQISAAGIILAVISYFIRGALLPYGVHTLVHLLAMSILIIFFFRTSFPLAATAALLSLVILGFLEVLLWPFIFFITGLSVKQIWAQRALRILIPLPELIILGMMTWWLVKRKITIPCPWSFQQKAAEKKPKQEQDS